MVSRKIAEMLTNKENHYENEPNSANIDLPPPRPERISLERPSSAQQSRSSPAAQRKRPQSAMQSSMTRARSGTSLADNPYPYRISENYNPFHIENRATVA